MRALVAVLLLGWGAAWAQPLPSWNEGPARQAVLKFVEAAKSVPAPQRIAVFDNDGTLWSEQPLYFQFSFALDMVKQAAPKHPEWKDDPVFQALAKQDRAVLAKLGHKPVLRLIGHANSGMTTEEYDRKSRIGKLDKALDEAEAKGWTVVDMKKDWKKIYAFEQ